MPTTTRKIFPKDGLFRKKRAILVSKVQMRAGRKNETRPSMACKAGVSTQKIRPANVTQITHMTNGCKENILESKTPRNNEWLWTISILSTILSPLNRVYDINAFRWTTIVQMCTFKPNLLLRFQEKNVCGWKQIRGIERKSYITINPNRNLENSTIRQS